MKLVFIIGPARSGTSIFARIIASSTEVAYVGENSDIWRGIDSIGITDVARYGLDASLPLATDLSSKLRSRAARSARVILDKTPSNCLRVHRLQKMYPTAKFIFIARDPVSTIRSYIRKSAGDHRKVTKLDDVGRTPKILSLAEIVRHKFKTRNVSDIVAGNFLRNIRFALGYLNLIHYPWGPKFLGFRDFKKSDRLTYAIALWKQCVNSMLCGYYGLSGERRLFVAYEHLVRDQRECLERVSSFLGLSIPFKEGEYAVFPDEVSDADVYLRELILEMAALESNALGALYNECGIC